jgi:chitinase
VPFVNEALGAAFGNVAIIGRVALLIGEAGNTALTIYNIVEDLLSALFAILEVVVLPFSVTSRSLRVVFKEGADFRKALKDVDLRKLRDSFFTKDARI